MLLRSFVTPTRTTRFDEPILAMSRAFARSMDDVLAGLPSATEAAALSLRLDVKEDEKAFTITADLPGLNEKDVDVTFDDGVLTLRGEKKIERDEKKDTWHLSERSYGRFVRKLSLPSGIKAEAIEATFAQGVLSIILPKEIEPQKTAKKIAIKTG
jgi:HSP20 family protein